MSLHRRTVSTVCACPAGSVRLYYTLVRSIQITFATRKCCIHRRRRSLTKPHVHMCDITCFPPPILLTLTLAIVAGAMGALRFASWGVTKFPLPGSTAKTCAVLAQPIIIAVVFAHLFRTICSRASPPTKTDTRLPACLSYTIHTCSVARAVRRTTCLRAVIPRKSLDAFAYAVNALAMCRALVISLMVNRSEEGVNNHAVETKPQQKIRQRE